MFMKEKKKSEKRRFHWKSIILASAAIILLIALCIAMMPLARFLITPEGQASVTAKMEEFGIFAPVVFVALQVIQVVIAVIPGGPVPIIGGMLFGEFAALILCLVGFFLGTALVYYLVQWLGRPLVDRFVTEKHFQKFDFLMEGKRLEALVFLVFFLPGLPKDALTYLVSFNSKIKPMRLFILTTLGRTPATILTVYVGGNIWDGNFKAASILILVMVALAILGLWIKRYIDKRAEIHDAKKKKE